MTEKSRKIVHLVFGVLAVVTSLILATDNAGAASLVFWGVLLLSNVGWLGFALLSKQPSHQEGS